MDLYVDLDKLSRYEYYPLDNREFKEEIFGDHIEMNMKTIAPKN